MRPILSAMLRNKTGAVLVALQIAFTLAMSVNAVFIIGQRIEKMTRPTGMDVANIITLQSWAVSEDADIEQSVHEDLVALRALPGVVSASSINNIPLSGGGWGDELKPTAGPDAPTAGGARYQVDEHGLESLGLGLASGRWFEREEIFYREPASHAPIAKVIVTQPLADALFPDGGALGATLYDELDRPIELIGIVEHMQGAWINWDKLDQVILVPEIPSGPQVRYVIRAETGALETLLPQVEATLVEVNRKRVIRKVEPMSEVVARSYSRDRAMAVVLLVVTALIVAVTALGIVGLASFTVKQRTKQIGTRRAVGARKIDIIRYFLTENWLITTVGVTGGALLALAFNFWLVTEYSLDKLHPAYVPLGILSLWALGLLAVLGPARKASGIPPAVATRTV